MEASKRLASSPTLLPRTSNPDMLSFYTLGSPTSKLVFTREREAGKSPLRSQHQLLGDRGMEPPPSFHSPHPDHTGHPRGPAPQFFKERQSEEPDCECVLVMPLASVLGSRPRSSHQNISSAGQKYRGRAGSRSSELTHRQGYLPGAHNLGLTHSGVTLWRETQLKVYNLRNPPSSQGGRVCRRNLHVAAYVEAYILAGVQVDAGHLLLGFRVAGLLGRDAP